MCVFCDYCLFSFSHDLCVITIEETIVGYWVDVLIILERPLKECGRFYVLIESRKTIHVVLLSKWKFWCVHRLGIEGVFTGSLDLV